LRRASKILLDSRFSLWQSFAHGRDTGKEQQADREQVAHMNICPNCGYPIRDGQQTRTLTHEPIARSRYQWGTRAAKTETYHADCDSTPEAVAGVVAAIREAARANGMENDPSILQAIAVVEARIG
jgi:ribosome-binding protein aMBF1 (putative translation factor)